MAENYQHYDHSQKMINITVNCNAIDDVNKLKAMDIDRRWNEDNRIPTWTFGMMNFGFDQNFIQNAMIINDTDDRVQTILEDEEIIGDRNIRYNGNWFKLNLPN